jgi:L-rhamnose mutarotase
MARYCFQLHVRPERLDEYTERHRAVWPDMLEEVFHLEDQFADAGWPELS